MAIYQISQKLNRKVDQSQKKLVKDPGNSNGMTPICGN